MTNEELARALGGLYAYDTGCVSSGIHDEELRARVKEELAADEPHNFLYPPRLSYIAREMFLSDEAIDLGYGMEDFIDFVKWLDDYSMLHG